MGKETIMLIANLIPVALDLTSRLIDFAEAAKGEGYDIPTMPELKALNEKLKALPDL